MAKKHIAIAVIVGIIIGSIGTYYSNYIFSIVGMEELSFPYTMEEKNGDVKLQTIPKTIFTNELQYTLVEVQKTDFGINGEKPLEGGIFLITKVTIENFGKQEVIVYGKNWLLKDENERVYSPKTFNAKPENNENIFSIRIPPGFKIIKSIGFEIPSNVESTRELFVPDKPRESSPILLGIV